MSENTYPQWQTAIREAQAKRKEEVRLEREKEADQKRLEDEKNGALLARILKDIFEIEAPAPVDGSVVLPADENGIVTTFRAHSIADDDNAVYFDIYVYRRATDDIEGHSHVISNGWRRWDSIGDTIKAQLADSLDWTDQFIESEREKQAERAARIAEAENSNPYALPQAATTEERFLSALRDLIREAQPKF